MSFLGRLYYKILLLLHTFCQGVLTHNMGIFIFPFPSQWWFCHLLHLFLGWSCLMAIQREGIRDEDQIVFHSQGRRIVVLLRRATRGMVDLLSLQSLFFPQMTGRRMVSDSGLTNLPVERKLLWCTCMGVSLGVQKGCKEQGLLPFCRTTMGTTSLVHFQLQHGSRRSGTLLEIGDVSASCRWKQFLDVCSWWHTKGTLSFDTILHWIKAQIATVVMILPS